MTATVATLDDLRRGPATVGVPETAAALGVSRSAFYEALRRGDDLPVKALRVCGRWRITTASLLHALEDSERPGA